MFYGESRTTPLHTKAFINALYDALETIGINEEERKARAITFHSLATLPELGEPRACTRREAQAHDRASYGGNDRALYPPS